jgi:hypothetical protein
MSIYESLTNCDLEVVKDIIKHLNRHSVISDEDKYHIQSTLIENWTSDCTEYLKKYGYTGGNLECVGDYFTNYGAAYALYDEGNCTRKEAMTYLTKLVQSKQ